LPKVEHKPVDETTPTFRNFTIRNVYVNGAERAIFIRGLPEMPVKDILLENMMLQAKKGIDVQEASDIVFSDVRVLAEENDPSVDITQSRNILFDKLNLGKNRMLSIRVNGERSEGIVFRKSDINPPLLKFELGATQKSVTLEQ